MTLIASKEKMTPAHCFHVVQQGTPGTLIASDVESEAQSDAAERNERAKSLGITARYEVKKAA